MFFFFFFFTESWAPIHLWFLLKKQISAAQTALLLSATSFLKFGCAVSRTPLQLCPKQRLMSFAIFGPLEGQNFHFIFFFFLSHPRASSTFCSHKAFIGFLFCWFVPSLYCIIENIHCLLVFGIWASVSAYCPTGDISSEKSIIQEFFFFFFPQ